MAEDDFKTDIELMKKDIGMISKLVDKFDTTIEKLQQVANDISKIVSLQEQKISTQEKINDEVDKVLDRQQLDHASEMKELNRKTAEIIAKIEQTKSELNEKINSIEKWRYAVMAVISFVVFLLGNALSAAKLFFN